MKVIISILLSFVFTNMIHAFDVIIKNTTKKYVELKLMKEKDSNSILREIKSEGDEGHLLLAPGKELSLENIGKKEIIFYREKKKDMPSNDRYDTNLLGIRWTDNYYFPIFISKIMEDTCSSCNPFREYIDHTIAIIAIKKKGLNPLYSYFTIQVLPKSFSDEILGMFKTREILDFSIEFKLKGLDDDGMIKVGEVIDELENIKLKPVVSATDIKQKRTVAEKQIKRVQELKQMYKDKKDVQKLLQEIELYLLHEVEIASLALLIIDDSKKIDEKIAALQKRKRYTKADLSEVENDITKIVDYLSSLKEEKKIRSYLEMRLYHYSLTVFKDILKRITIKKELIQELSAALLTR